MTTSGVASVNEGFSAQMVTTVQGDTSVAQMSLKGEKLHLQVVGGRTFSTMIVRYDKDVLWLMAPAARQYMEMVVDAVGLGVPHFFHPDIRIEKIRMGEEIVGGIKAVKYRAHVSMLNGKKEYLGFLWESIDRPGFPLRWEEPQTVTTVEWRQQVFTEIPDLLFEVPKEYRKITLPQERPLPEKNESQSQ
ncbi:MAG: hypothetical protein KJ804_07535 [Proteobacteria bacterium]|nr:hypothetical protein [Pseudomonadota bacterium]MBU1058152.1 hypothetical protein [Pseudomonadota bacterium]